MRASLAFRLAPSCSSAPSRPAVRRLTPHALACSQRRQHAVAGPTETATTTTATTTTARTDSSRDASASASTSTAATTAPHATTQYHPSPIYPEPRGADKHHDLSSFLKHAARVSLNPATTTYVGTLYEYTVASHLAPFGFTLRRVGGASDRGIDLLGTWTLPLQDPITLRVLVQCKAGARQRIGPHLMRELEGAFVGAPVGWRSNGHGTDRAVLGLLVAERPATKGIRDALARSQWPMMFVCCSNVGHLHQMLWNQRAEQECSLAGLGVTLRHSVDVGNEDAAQIVLTWKGTPLPPATINLVEG